MVVIREGQALIAAERELNPVAELHHNGQITDWEIEVASARHHVATLPDDFPLLGQTREDSFVRSWTF